MFSLTMYIASFLVLVGAITVGYLFVKMPGIRKTFLPASVAGGLMLLVLGPEVLGVFPGSRPIEGAFYEIWEPLPGLLISVIFAMLFLGKPLRSLRGMWKLAAPQAAFGQTIAWGYYAIGGAVVLFILGPYLGAHHLTAALLEISFGGGHGTAAGLAPVFEEFNFQAGQEMAVAMATTSLFITLAIGFIAVNIARRKGIIRERPTPYQQIKGMVYHRRIVAELDRAGISLREELGVWNVLRHTVLIIFSVALGYGIHAALMFIENNTWAHYDIKIFGYMPTFVFCLFSGMIAQSIWVRMGFKVSRPLVDLISGGVLAILVSTAIATMKLGFLAEDGLIFLGIVLTGVVWVLFCFVVLAKHMFPRDWFTNAIITVGQAMGTTATGLLFANIVDPKQRTGAVESFGYKQLMFEPIVGGGLATALSMPAIIFLGLPTFTVIAACVCVAWMVFGLVSFRKRA